MNVNNYKDSDSRLMQAATKASVFVAIFLILIKTVGYALTGSVTLLSSLLDSFLDSLGSIINFIAIRHALEPADEEHRFGHGKAEPLAGIAQSGFIIASSGFLIFEAILRLRNPQVLEYAHLGIVIIFISLIVTFLLVRYQKYVVKQTSSIAIKADSIHYMSDFLLNGLVIISLVLVSQFNLWWIDPVFAILIAIYIAWSARKIATESLNQLMDRELPDEDRNKIIEIVKSNDQVINIHELRTRMSGRNIFIQFHLDLDKNLSLHEVHSIAESVKRELYEVFPDADVLIHEDPA